MYAIMTLPGGNMKVLELKIDDSIFDKFKSILDLIPKNKIKIKEVYDDSHIPLVSSEEQRDIEQIIRKKSRRTPSHSKILKI